MQGEWPETLRPRPSARSPRPSREQAQKRPSAPPFAAQPSSVANEHRRRPRPARGASPGGRASPRRRAAPPSSRGSCANACAHRSSGSANVGTPQPSIATGIVRRRRTPAAAATSREQLLLQRMRREPVAARLEPARPADGEEARVLARAVVLDRRRRPRPSRARPRSPARLRGARGRRRAAPGGARCEAHAIAISRSPRSGRARTSGSAWSGLADERRKVRSRGSPASATICPSRTATA